jgi:hypothetical protein
MKTPGGSTTGGIEGRLHDKMNPPYALRSKRPMSFVTPNGGSGKKRKNDESGVFSPTRCKSNEPSTSHALRLSSKDLQDCIIVCNSPDPSPMKAFRSSGLAVEIVDTSGERRSVLVGEGWLIEDLISDVCGRDYDLSKKAEISDGDGRTLDRSQQACELNRLDTYYMSC